MGRHRFARLKDSELGRVRGQLKPIYRDPGLPGLVPALAPSAEQWQSLFTLYIIAAVIVAGAVFVMFFYFLAKYRKKPGAQDPKDAPRVGVMADRGNPALAAILTALLISLFFGLTLNTFALNAYLQNPPNDPNALYVDVIGFQWGWRFVYPNARELIGELRVPEINRTCTPSVRGCWSGTVILNITSADVFHSFGIPDLKIKRDAIPGRVNQAWFVAEQSGIFLQAIRCYELCGTGHALMLADLIVQSPDSFHDWYLTGV
ncbi:MAG: cytochrome c oxidase subunit II [Methanobacteriota archaeon]|nr:MAG: cytochrome c oxidase subunit II [Euryarchaeota archaeon]